MASQQSVSCPALFLTAPSSGEGKTTITAALARYFRDQGKVVRVFKTGPDYLDPQILAQASGQDVEQLDLWMAGENYCQQKLFEAAQTADLILVEGAMGMFDGEPSSADLAARFNIPVAIVMNVKGMAQTAAAIAMGLANYRSDISVAGLIANNCGTERHAQLIRDALPESLPMLATLARDPEVALPERHLGLVQAEEVRDELEHRFTLGAEWIKGPLAEANKITELPEPVEFFSAQLPEVEPLLQGKTIAIAKDEAFSFIYDANLRLLEQMGAELKFFSPLHDSTLPEADSLWLPGGYPELHAQALSDNHKMQVQVRDFHLVGKPILAECGGFLYCLEDLTDLEDNCRPMAGLLQGHGAMRGKRGCQGMQTAMLPEGEVQAHAHHRSRSAGTPEPVGYGRRQRHPAPGESIYREKGLTASYLHLFFASNPEAIAAIFSGNLEG
ncbi:cobyrinate a,c-diamide synthase [Neptuniibacter caesariensis]|uniref:Cobyrinic acid a,c-diamide synthase n=1 Tax=Neptuniibacter caesariensis TaxID=207954 RepID=A0A7U8C6Q9_NEPCE|nr:cobyrinate a,c-diamide synthase [Neptuniibacter caesariensis]EAR62324.1 cobyrinic acid a,c-diamide synthase [Oceanospirillum sp. MED92] [Neptuniibacter caesariensis]